MPFAIWFYLGIEGVAMVAEEVKDPQKNIPKGYIARYCNLGRSRIGVMIFSGGMGNWKSLSTIDYPLPASISMVLGKQTAGPKFLQASGYLV